MQRLETWILETIIDISKRTTTLIDSVMNKSFYLKNEPVIHSILLFIGLMFTSTQLQATGIYAIILTIIPLLMLFTVAKPDESIEYQSTNSMETILFRPIKWSYWPLIGILLQTTLLLIVFKPQPATITGMGYMYYLIVAPVYEELLYRELLQNQVFKNKMYAPYVVAFFFALIHKLFLFQFIHSLIYSLVYEKTNRDVRATIAMHIAYNAIVLSMV